MRFLTALLVVVSSVGAASAQSVRFTGNTVFMAIQCDVGRFGIIAKKAGIDSGMQAHVKYSRSEDVSNKASAEVGLSLAKIFQGPSVKASRTWERTDGRTIEGKFKISEGNTGACGPHQTPRVDVGVMECLKDATTPIKSNVSINCDKTRIAAGKFTANGGINWTFVKIAPEYDYDVKVTYTIHVDAPAKDDAKADKPKTVSAK
jgi:hypothetical protein